MSYAIDAGGAKNSLEILKFCSRWKLSSKISLTYSIVLLVTLIFTSAITTIGVYYIFHHQAARAIEISVEHTIETATKLNSIDETFFNTGAVMPSVIFRVNDDTGRKILDSSPAFPDTEKMLKYVRSDPPIWASAEYKLIETPHSFFYYKNLPLEIGGKIFQFHFIKTITFEKQYIRDLLLILFVVDILGLGLAVAAGNIFIQRRLLNKIEENFKRQQNFIADASHELRTPITIIRGYADMLENYGADDPELVVEASTAIKNSAQNMQTLTENLLFLSRADQGTQPINKVPVAINEILKNTIGTFKNSRIEILSESEINIDGDSMLLQKMFAIFIDNALTYSDGKVVVQVENNSVKIIDNGIGIAPEYIDRIFDRFFRTDESRTKSADEKFSVGLGLSIAKWIADKHDIKIKVVSEIDKGSTFELTFKH